MKDLLKSYPQIIGAICILCALTLAGASAAYILAPKWAESIDREERECIIQKTKNLELLNQYSSAFYYTDSIEIKNIIKLHQNYVCYQIDDNKCGWWVSKNSVEEGILYCDLLFPTEFQFQDLGSISKNIEHVKELITISYDTIMHRGTHSNSSFWDLERSMLNLENNNYAVNKDSNLVNRDTYCRNLKIYLPSKETITYTCYPYYSFSIYPKDELFILHKTGSIQKTCIIILLSILIPLVILIILLTIYYRKYIKENYTKIDSLYLSCFFQKRDLHPEINKKAKKIHEGICEESGSCNFDSMRYKLFLLNHEEEIKSLYVDNNNYKEILSLQEKQRQGFTIILREDNKILDLTKWNFKDIKSYFSINKKIQITQKNNEILINNSFDEFVSRPECKRFIDQLFANKEITIEEKKKVLREKDQILEQIRKENQAEATRIKSTYPNGYKLYTECSIEPSNEKIIEDVQTIITNERLITNWYQRKKIKPKWEDFSGEIENSPSISNQTTNATLNGLNSNIPKDNIFVDYYIEDSLPTDNYVILEFPKLGCVVWPHRTHLERVNRRGFLEREFEVLLLKYLSNEQIEIRSDVTLQFDNLIRPFEPDIAIIVKDSSIRIDIEIDEPYSGLSREPIHYWGCGDEERDLNIIQHGWCVFRFAEKQIKTQPKECLALIARQIRRMCPSYILPYSLRNLLAPLPISIWSKQEALILAENKEREKYLGIEHFGFVPNGIIKQEDTILTDEEKLAQTHIERQYRTSKEKFNYQVSTRDNRISFDKMNHKYSIDGVDYTPVSTLIDEIFPKFNSEYWSKRKATPQKTQKHILEEWDCKGAMSREVGTFMHEQIALFFENKDYSDSYDFHYSGQFVTKHEDISIKKELNQFFDFNHHFNPIPLRVEWPIFIENYKIAGTIDLLTYDKLGNKIMFDWKRTHKLGYEHGNCIFSTQKTNSYDSGIQIDKFWFEDCNFIKYSLQQNIYKYILEKKYGITINKCYLVIFHQDYKSYHCIEVPDMVDETIAILKYWRKLQ